MFNGTDVNLVEDINPSGFSIPSSLTVYKNNLYFKAEADSNLGRELYVYDGINVSLVSDIYPGSSDSTPNNLFIYDDKLYFIAYNNTGKNELYSFNGSNLKLETLPTDPSLSNHILFNNKVYFSASNSSLGRELFSYDGNTFNLVSDIYPGTGSSYPENFLVKGNYLFFIAKNDTPNTYPFYMDTLEVVNNVYSNVSGWNTNPGYITGATFDNNVYFLEYSVYN